MKQTISVEPTNSVGPTISVGPTFMVGLKFLAVVYCVIACTPAARAQASAAFDACSAKAMNQTALTTCAAEELTRAEHGLHVAYAKLRQKVASRPETLEKIRSAERAWMAYRDAYLEATFPAKAKQAEYGSIYPTDADLLLADLTRQHTAAVVDLLKTMSGCGPYWPNSNERCVHPSSQ